MYSCNTAYKNNHSLTQISTKYEKIILEFGFLSIALSRKGKIISSLARVMDASEITRMKRYQIYDFNIKSAMSKRYDA